MLKYLVIQICDSAPSFCHYDSYKNSKLIDLGNLRKGIIWAMKRNLSVQVIYPNYELPIDYQNVLDEISYVAIVSDIRKSQSFLGDIIIHSGLSPMPNPEKMKDKVLSIRCSFRDFLNEWQSVIPFIDKVDRLNITFLDIDKINEFQFAEYKRVLNELAESFLSEYIQGHFVQCNLLTDRFMLDKMNNCNAGIETITLAPDGRFYLCPAFYFDRGDFGLEESKMSVGDIEKGINIPNSQLLDLKHAPLCRICDAFHCKRCVWLSRKTTYELNTPSREQCVVAHLERNASRLLLKRIQEMISFIPQKEIKEINYLDPFDINPNW